MQNFIKRYGVPWEQTHPHNNVNAHKRKTNSALTKSDSSTLLNIALGVGCIFNTNLLNTI